MVLILKLITKTSVIGDWLETCTFSLTFKSANSNYPCHFCQTYRNDLTSIRKDCIIICNKENIQEYYNNGSAERLKIFAKEVQLIARLTASEFRDLMKVMVFVVDNLLNKNLSEVYVRWNRIYLMSRFEKFTKSDLENFQIYYIVDAIRDFEVINRYTTETYKSLHKTYVKISYRLSNKKDVEM
ncbi:hypothetical protein Glove_134g4 [Diversispora epigaea]|uniref:Uncharacterized protein n=1 Tax=Diversispora epigaea TaxID=1348612 RepID=A0A397IX20_9GLOM|nr:hypothetical protein Glove_134g4 [Diversispora epigaea]